jgi:phospholipase/lecithinase/hemolysin
MKLAKTLQPLIAATMVVSLLAAPAVAQEVTYEQFFTFGDSLADNGNVWLTSKLLGVSPAPPPSETPNRAYDGGRFSNGPIAFEYLWNRLRVGTSMGPLRPYIMSPVVPAKGAVNYAFGGTGTPLLDQTPGGLYAPGLLGQVELFRLGLAGRKPSKKALYAIVTGANDYRVDQYNSAPTDPQVVIANIVGAIRRLHAIGARDILVLSLPNLGCLPYGTTPCDDNPPPPAPGEPPTPSQLTAYHNGLLAAAIDGLRLPGARIRYVDVNPAFAELRNAVPTPPGPMLPGLDLLFPAPLFIDENGVPVPTSACLFVAPALCPEVPATALGPNVLTIGGLPLVFWDVVHPTTYAHSKLADVLFERLPR